MDGIDRACMKIIIDGEQGRGKKLKAFIAEVVVLWDEQKRRKDEQEK